MKIHAVPVRDDNYAYILQSSVDGAAVFVDPYDVPAVSDAASKLGITKVVGLLTTHHHHDHSGGNDAFATAYPNTPIYGGSAQIPALTKQLVDGDTLTLLQGITITCLATPCHTQDHLCYHVSSAGKQGVFTGDTLFVSGCGRFFEGTPHEMLAAMDKLASLPKETVVYCGHEYTRSNAAFSAAVLPSNEEAIAKLVHNLKNGQQTTTGVYTIGDEKRHNPFMRCRDAVVREKVAQLTGENVDGDVEVMRLLRELKNAGTVKANI
ncbi:related to GLO4-glyoxalase II (hydroxyacylglutathione hydrolase) [Sporisorium reilianum f. sp. reilianum]|uniref:hydroxyacylglutathione hydrolase n=1 Tax=Sporisorium reilianum f. sp. reilianum TaxID=72559 RepID=A0A2N8U7E7_9BASI|nr:related to GLO4-glyoxalase II (hydroxyacylglutathione hydrolase) [Sporisorium reilianum f. sp. reilianum]